MMSSKKRNSFFVRNKKGQVAIFVALIFQVLFLFFAMVINIGLLVHHKINLQNSVDLAAYYGAMRQAESMNAVAHVNYQIRQSWKLLTWRYRVIGSAGEMDSQGKAQPFIKQGSGVGPVDADSDKINNQYSDFYEAPSFCITYQPFRPMPANENTCRQMATFSGVKLFRPPAIIAGFLGFSHSIQAASQYMLDSARARCRAMGDWNYLMLAKFVASYNFDQADRMATINKIARAASASTEDFTDIDGASVLDGVTKTLKNNLTYANNNSSLSVSLYNSLGSDACGSSSVADTRPPKWLNTILISPGFNFIDTYCESDLEITGKGLTGGSDVKSSNCHYTTASGAVDNYCGPRTYAKGESDLAGDIDSISQYIGPRQDPNNIYNFTLGVEKNPWCMAYVGVKASTQVQIPFSPFGAITLRARAFAKPFGGRVGPWFYNRWLSGQTESTGSSSSEQLDQLLPKRVKDPSQNGPNKDRIVNYSRFVGDTFGLMSRMVLGYGAKAIYKLDTNWNGTLPDPRITNGSPNFAHWDHLPFNFTGSGKPGDILAWAGSADSTPMRDLELAAIAPDPFDYAYYSIEPDYYHNYYLKLKKGLISGGLGEQMLRPDIGSRIGDSDLESFSVKDQIRRVKAKMGGYPLNNYQVSDRQTYISLDWKHALTGWADKSLIDYSLDTTKFGKCIFPADVDSKPYLNPPTSGNCAGGGTTGYSVKLISSDYLNRTDLQLGGENSGSGPLMNPPPSDW